MSRLWARLRGGMRLSARELGLIGLLVVTSVAIGTIGWWMVPVYLVWMVWLVGPMLRRTREQGSVARGAEAAPAMATPEPVQGVEPPAQAVKLPVEAPSEPGTRRRRRRVDDGSGTPPRTGTRTRRKPREAAVPVVPTTRKVVRWEKVGPNKFVRIEEDVPIEPVLPDAPLAPVVEEADFELAPGVNDTGTAFEEAGLEVVQEGDDLGTAFEEAGLEVVQEGDDPGSGMESSAQSDLGELQTVSVAEALPFVVASAGIAAEAEPTAEALYEREADAGVEEESRASQDHGFAVVDHAAIEMEDAAEVMATETEAEGNDAEDTASAAAAWSELGAGEPEDSATEAEAEWMVAEGEPGASEAIAEWSVAEGDEIAEEAGPVWSDGERAEKETETPVLEREWGSECGPGLEGAEGWAEIEPSIESVEEDAPVKAIEAADREVVMPEAALSACDESGDVHDVPDSAVVVNETAVEAEPGETSIATGVAPATSGGEAEVDFDHEARAGASGTITPGVGVRTGNATIGSTIEPARELELRVPPRLRGTGLQMGAPLLGGLGPSARPEGSGYRAMMHGGHGMKPMARMHRPIPGRPMSRGR